MALVTSKRVIEPAVMSDAHHMHPMHAGDGFLICKSPEKLHGLMDALGSQKTVHYVSDGDFSTHDLVMLLLQRCKPADAFITTYALREFPVRQLITAIDKKELLSVNLLLDNRAKVRTPEVYQLASFNLTKICLTNIHAKVTVLRGPAGCYTVMGSANWTQNRRIECGIVSTDEALAAFHMGWITKAMENGELFE